MSLVLVLGASQLPQHRASGAELAALRDALIAYAPTGSVARVDSQTGQVQLRLAGDASAELKARIARHPGLVRQKQVAPVAPTMALYGGHGMTAQSGGFGCTAGFLATYFPVTYVLTAGHCLKDSRLWDRKGSFLGEREYWVYGPQGDYGLLRVKGVNMSPAGMINLPSGPRGVGGTFDPFVGQWVCFMGNNSKLQCGGVTGLDTTVTYRGLTHPVNGMIETTICVQNGDSGGPLFTPPEAAGGLLGIGILSGQTEMPCGNPDYRSYFQPLQEILNTYSLYLLTS